MSVLSKSDILKKNIIIDGSDTCRREISYDIRVGHIHIPCDHRIKKFFRNVKKKSLKKLTSIKNVNGLDVEYEIPPQGMCLVFSKEQVSVPEDICCLVMPKTGVCREGLFCLSTGIVDPGYKGYISTILINFSRQPKLLKKNDPFLRLVFISVKNSTVKVNNSSSGSDKSFEDYVATCVSAARDYPSSFLDIPERVDEINKTLLKKERRFIYWLLVLIVAIFTIVNFFVPEFLTSNTLRTSAIHKEIESEIKELYLGEFKSLKKDISEINSKVTKLQSKPPNSSSQIKK